jgi:alpha-glutamyl/putrescinyl thymine pyrophosphorylase clade 1
MSEIIDVTANRFGAPLFAYMIERENIRKRKESGAAGPWTDDPILREFSFTNVRRSDDRTTRDLMKNFYGPNRPAAQPGEVLFNCALARFFGKADAVVEIGWQTDWDAEAVLSVARDLDKQKRLFTGAYVITNNGESCPKVELICRQVLPRVWHNRNRIADAALRENGWHYLVGQLRQLPALGGTGFMAKEIAQDFMLAMNWTPRDRDTFTPVGKGARRGLNRLYDRAVDYKITSSTIGDERRFLQEVRELFAMRHENLTAGFIELQLHDIQFNLCELDKYLRTSSGEGRPKRRYRTIGNGDATPR